MDDLSAYIRFIQEAEGLKCMTRTAWTSTGRRESTAEHSWRLALLAGLLLPAYPGLDARRVLMLCLAHDLGEVYEGDISAALRPDQEEKERQERAAVKRAAASLPEKSGRELCKLWEEYNACETPEARLVKALIRPRQYCSITRAPIRLNLIMPSIWSMVKNISNTTRCSGICARSWMNRHAKGC